MEGGKIQRHCKGLQHYNITTLFSLQIPRSKSSLQVVTSKLIRVHNRTFKIKRTNYEFKVCRMIIGENEMKNMSDITSVKKPRHYWMKTNFKVDRNNEVLHNVLWQLIYFNTYF